MSHSTQSPRTGRSAAPSLRRAAWHGLLFLVALAGACAPDRSVAPPAAPIAAPAAARAVQPAGTSSFAIAAIMPYMTLGDGRNACWVRTEGALVCAGVELSASARWPAGGGRYLTVVEQARTTSAFACAIRSDGAADCFRGGPTPPSTAVAPDTKVPGFGKFAKLVASDFAAGLGLFVCGLRTDGRIECWGDSTAPGMVGVHDGTGSAFVDVAASTDAACGVRQDGAVECWGALANTGIPTVQPAIGGVPFVRVAMGPTYACGLANDTTVKCWGAAVQTGGVPATVETPEGYAEIAAWQIGNMVCLRRVGGRVECVGSAANVASANTLFGAAPFPAMTNVSHGGLVCALRSSPVPPSTTALQEALCMGSIINGALRDLIVLRAPQTLAFTSTPATPARAQTTYAATAAATSGFAPAFASLTPAVCTTTTDGQVSLLATGTCTLTADQAGIGISWLPAPQATQSFTVDLAALQVTLGGLAQVFDGTPKPVTATTTPAGVPVTVTYTPAGAAATTTAPSAPGDYAVSVTPAHPTTWWGGATGTLTIEAPRFSVAPTRLSLSGTTTVSVYVYSTPIVDATQIAPLTVRLRVPGGSATGAAVALRNGLPMTSTGEYNADGRLDRQLVFLMKDLRAAGLTTSTTSFVLEDQTGSYRFRGTLVAMPQVVP